MERKAASGVRLRQAWLWIMLGLLASSGCRAGETCLVSADLWQRPRSGTAVLSQATLGPCVAAWLAAPDARMVIHHAGGDDAQMQATELRSWLVALALDGGRIELSNDLQPKESMRMEIREAK